LGKSIEVSMKKPDFFIVGAPKCGTTALHEYLKQHPDIFMPEEKEPHYFGSDLKFNRPRITKGKYLSYFQKARDEERIGEASVGYLCSKRAAYEIKEFSSSANIIIMLRNPVEMIFSLHSQLLYTGNEDITDFETALNAESKRRCGKCLPKYRVAPLEYLYYRDIAKYSKQVKRYFDVFGRENVHIIIFDDFKYNTAKVYKDTLHFLNVDDGFLVDFKIINPYKYSRSKIISNFLNNIINLPPLVKRLGKILVPHTSGRKRLLQGLRQWNTKYDTKPFMKVELRKRLQREFMPDIEHLSKLLGYDLIHWIKK